jgi:hypothetical protein
VGRGIFLIPELAFVYAVGRSISANAQDIFKTPLVEWLPGTSISKAGRTDLVFKTQDQKDFAIQFKRSGVDETFIQDITKLATLELQKYQWLFCALIDTWPNEIDPNPRTNAVEKDSGIPVRRLTDRFEFFSTKHPKYVKQVCCLVALWIIDPQFHMSG